MAYNEETRGKYKYGYMNRLGEFAVPLQYERTEIFSEGRGAIQSSESKKWGAVDKSGKLVIPFKFLNSFHFYDRVALAYENFEGTGVIDINGEYIIGPKFESIDKFREGLANVRDKKTRKHGFIDLSGEYVIAPTLQYANGFSGGFAAIGEISGK
ncbi:hypothetical protein LEP1GSC193_2908 [Leptospira alstonii serovar Pingchang str. 80-412]|uniref:WG repeat-containing protein n=2 Tax=Leptospira alstonii TaxID=28452 RepID=M6CXD5_9LEPT|nr:hypothetical protein LEP1GSC194_3256 [Leptospira alstonii serovar Sichuan str. 79601]EQA81643.1 hypothetical protein LEP1GSC193_2908 [Leptospira alstonii serovar Pingchang str. 80-412]